MHRCARRSQFCCVAGLGLVWHRSRAHVLAGCDMCHVCDAALPQHHNGKIQDILTDDLDDPDDPDDLDDLDDLDGDLHQSFIRGG